MQRSASRAQVLRGVIGLCRGGVAVLPEVSFSERLYDPAQRVSLADSAASEPDGSVVVDTRGDGQADSRFVGSRIEPLLQCYCEKRDGIRLFLRAICICE